MISHQVIQSSLEELRGITRIDLCVLETDGSQVASTFDASGITLEMTRSFAQSPAEGQNLQGCHFFKVYDEGILAYILLAKGSGDDAYMIGKVAVSELQNLIVAYKERYDRNNFIQNLLLDNLLLVDIYSQAKKLHIQTEAMRVVYLIETRDEKDVMALEAVRSVFAPKSQDIITAVDQKNIVVVKSVGEEDTYDTLDEIAVMLAGMLNTDEDSSRIRVAYGTMVSQIRDLSKSYKEAKMALEVVKIFYPEATVNAYHTLGIGRLIYQLPQPLCEMFMQEVFHENTPDTFDEETLSTIEKFFENNLNVSETARQLFVHRNTLVYRLEKLQKTTGLDIRVFEDALTFKIALMVASYMKYLEKEQL